MGIALYVNFCGARKSEHIMLIDSDMQHFPMYLGTLLTKERYLTPFIANYLPRQYGKGS